MIYPLKAIKPTKYSLTTPKHKRKTIQVLAQRYEALLKDTLSVYQQTEQAIELIEALGMSTKDAELAIRHFSLETLTTLAQSNKSATERLQEALTSPDYETRINAVRSLSRIKHLSARIKQILSDVQGDSQSAWSSLNSSIGVKSAGLNQAYLK